MNCVFTLIHFHPKVSSYVFTRTHLSSHTKGRQYAFISKSSYWMQNSSFICKGFTCTLIKTVIHFLLLLLPLCLLRQQPKAASMISTGRGEKSIKKCQFVLFFFLSKFDLRSVFRQKKKEIQRYWSNVRKEVVISREISVWHGWHAIFLSFCRKVLFESKQNRNSWRNV